MLSSPLPPPPFSLNLIPTPLVALSTLPNLSLFLKSKMEVVRTFSEILVMMRQKSHAFDLEKVGRYMRGKKSSCQLILSSFDLLW